MITYLIFKHRAGGKLCMPAFPNVFETVFKMPHNNSTWRQSKLLGTFYASSWKEATRVFDEFCGH